MGPVAPAEEPLAIPTSVPLAPAEHARAIGIPSPVDVGLNVAGRICTTGVRLVPRVTETLVAYDDGNRTLTYEASGMPTFVSMARNTWTVAPLDERRSRVLIDARFDTRGLLGLLGRWVILAQVGRASHHLANDLRHYVEHGAPSPRKRKQLSRRRP